MSEYPVRQGQVVPLIFRNYTVALQEVQVALKFVHVSHVREQAEQVEFTPLSKYPLVQGHALLVKFLNDPVGQALQLVEFPEQFKQL